LEKLLKTHDASDKALFFYSTFMLVGNGLKTPFWEAKWLHGAAPKDLAPGIFRRTRFKNRSVAFELRSNNWIRSLTNMNTSELMQEYVILFTALSTVQLSDQPDEVCWQWTTNGKFSVTSAYNCQFKGAYTFFPAVGVWKALAEPKCRFFAWLVIHNRALTTDVMHKKNWPCESLCSLCFVSRKLLTVFCVSAITLKPFGEWSLLT
jgi:hypothetical protein